MTSFPSIQKLFGLSDHRSVVRRTFLFGLFVVPAFGANFLVHYIGTNLLSTEQFGVFYVANTIGNVIYSGSVILNMFFTRFISTLISQGGFAAGVSGYYSLQRLVVIVGGVICSAAFGVLFALSEKLGLQSLAVVLMILLDAYTGYIADLGRMLLQSMHRTIHLGLYTLGWMVLRLLLFTLGVEFFNTVWGGLLGIVSSAIIVILAFHLIALRIATPKRVAIQLPAFSILFPFFISYGLLISICNLDILLSYFLLHPVELSVYSASSVFPKTILVLVTPMLQMLFPLMIEQHASQRAQRLVTYKISAVILALSVGACGFVWLTSGWLCGGPIGLKLCDGGTLNLMLLSVVPLTLLRLMVQIDLARGRDWRPFLLGIPTVAYVVWIVTAQRDVDTIAETFVIFSVIALACYGAAILQPKLFGRGVADS